MSVLTPSKKQLLLKPVVSWLDILLSDAYFVKVDSSWFKSLIMFISSINPIQAFMERREDKGQTGGKQRETKTAVCLHRRNF